MTQAAEQGHDGAQYNLGHFYCNELEVPQDVSKATFWFERAAEQGHVKSLITLGEILSDQDLDQETQARATACFMLAACNGNNPDEVNRHIDLHIGCKNRPRFNCFVSAFTEAAAQNPDNTAREILRQIAGLPPQSPPNPA